MIPIDRPKLEGSIAVGDKRRRRIGFSEFGSPGGPAVVWLHGTPGARRQIPTEAREYAETRGFRLIGLDRPGVGSSTPHRYESIADFTLDFQTVLNTLGVDRFSVIGLSGGGPYSLAVSRFLPDRVVSTGIVGGVAPVNGPDGIRGGAVDLAQFAVPLLNVAGRPIGSVLSTVLGFARPIADPAISLYGRLSPEADRELLSRPEFRAMFLDDLLHGGSRRMEAPFADLQLFVRDWGFRISDVDAYVHWWHGDADNIIPFAHGEHMVKLLPHAELHPLAGQSHISGLGHSIEMLDILLAAWDRPAAGSGDAGR
ncbi:MULTISPECIES: alpha/beta fold hydrolase [Gordonia]|uniref:Alpha/beta hydrolase n=1 Tax=Gordonia cholesterolivorans TaxID=559625 RepID=A0ABN3H187_9ACTN|nr:MULTISPECIES: alpha/beta hydrolase [Gordonia]KJR08990.1 alpha/beta hydrolase [Gordonia sihwensis]KXT57086.1 alpha/beta hydrolase [Gordonia sp. QH-12]WFN93435.1 alpha/beta hydrolase [Gordonia sihwensis]